MFHQTYLESGYQDEDGFEELLKYIDSNYDEVTDGFYDCQETGLFKVNDRDYEWNGEEWTHYKSELDEDDKNDLIDNLRADVYRLEKVISEKNK